MVLLRCVFCVLLASFVCDGVLVGELRRRERPGSNVVQTSRLLYPVDDLEPLCKTDLGHIGVCVDVRFCLAARRAISAGNHPVRCGWIDHAVPKVCCHPDQVVVPPPKFAASFRPPFYDY